MKDVVRKSPRDSRMTRRGFIQVGYSGLLGMGLPGLLAARSAAATGGGATGRGAVGDRDPLERRPGQHDSFDMKPEAPDKVRGEFKPIDTAVPGIRICEHLPRLAARADRLAIVRSMSHPEGNHLVAVHRVLTGQPSNPRGASDLDRVASRDDFPCYAAVLDRLRHRSDGIPSGVALPTRLVEGPLTWPGQDAGFLGPRHDPWQLRLDPSRPEARDDSLTLPAGLDPGAAAPAPASARPGRRAGPQRPVRRPAGRRTGHAVQRKGGQGAGHRTRRSSPGRPLRPAPLRPLALDRPATGRGGRPVVQATMGIVQTWDTHVANFPRLRDSLLPPLDQAVSALLDDLKVRGLLDETLVVMLGEFGRTPRISELKPGDVPGRDHWPAVFPAVFAGGGVVGGQVIGKSDRLGAYAVSKTFGPPDLAATVYHALGVDPATELRDRLGRPLRLCSGEVMTPLYTTAPI